MSNLFDGPQGYYRDNYLMGEYHKMRQQMIVPKSGSIPYPTPFEPARPLENPIARAQVLNFRMGVGEGEKIPFDLVETFYVRQSDVVFILIINKGKAVLLEDSAEQYPSDTLITQMRLLT